MSESKTAQLSEEEIDALIGAALSSRNGILTRRDVAKACMMEGPREQYLADCDERVATLSNAIGKLEKAKEG